MIYYGKGGWTWDDLYNSIPVFLRNFYLNEMLAAVEREKEQYEKAKSGGKAIGPAIRKSS